MVGLPGLDCIQQSQNYTDIIIVKAWDRVVISATRVDMDVDADDHMHTDHMHSGKSRLKQPASCL